MKSLKSYVIESMGTGETYIDPKKTDIAADFKLLNDKLFGGELTPVETKWFRSKTKLGLMEFEMGRKKIGRRTIITSEEPKTIKISSFFKITRQQYLDVLAHEMIHVWTSQKRFFGDGHGKYFTSKMNEINKRFPEYSIKPSEEADDYAVATPTKKSGGKSKEYGVLLFNNDGEYSTIVVSEKIIEDRALLEQFVKDFAKIVPSNFRGTQSLTLDIYKTDIPEFGKFKVKQKLSLRGLNLFDISDDLVTKVKGTTKILDEKFI